MTDTGISGSPRFRAWRWALAGSPTRLVQPDPGVGARAPVSVMRTDVSSGLLHGRLGRTAGRVQLQRSGPLAGSILEVRPFASPSCIFPGLLPAIRTFAMKGPACTMDPCA